MKMSEITPDKIINTETKKVFCGDCKHYAKHFIYEQCSHPSNIEEQTTHATIDRYMIQKPAEKNAENNCKHFQKLPFDFVPLLSRYILYMGIFLASIVFGYAIVLLIKAFAHANGVK